MKNTWNKKQIKSLFDLVEKNNQQNLPIMKSFEMFAKKVNKNKLTIRNFYYSFAKMLKNNQNMQKKYQIDIKKHNIQKFEHFDEYQETVLVNQIEALVNDGMSVREACQKLSDGDIKKMIRLQNKYQSIKSNCKVLKFPEQKHKSQNSKLSDSEINSLFLGLVKLVKEQALGESQQKVQKYLEATSEQKRKQIISTQQSQTEIAMLKEKIKDLQEQNQKLNDKLKLYRIDYVQNITNSNSDSAKI